MSFKEVNRLRKEGKIEEALNMALTDLKEAQEPLFMPVTADGLNSELKNINKNLLWPKRALAWVYYEYLKKYSQPDSFDAFKKNLINIKDLALPEEEKMVFDKCAWQIGSIVFGLQKAEHVEYEKINEIFETIKGFSFTKPSEAYSFIYKAFHKGYQNWSKYLTFADWWNFEYFRSEDYLKEEFNGKKIMSIAEQAYIAYSKKLLEGELVDPHGQQRLIDKDKIQSFLPKLDSIIEKHPDYQYPPYFKAKLLLALGNEGNILSAFLPFAKQKRNEFWVWELMAEIFAEDKKLQFACYCKALSIDTPEHFLVKLRQKFSGMLVEKKLYSEAKTEIQQVITTLKKNEWKLPNQITQWTKQDWYKSATAKKDNKDLYLQHVKAAEEILFQDIPEEIIAVEFVNENKNILNFVKDKLKFGFFNYSGHLDKPQIGDILKVRFNGEGKDGFYKILTAKKAESNTKCEAINNFKGNLRLITPHNFGFIEDVFIEPKLIQKNNLADGQNATGKAILSFNKKKNEWGWKAFEVNV